jgi:hypothetical protein
MLENINADTATVKADIGNLVVDDPVLAEYATEIRHLGKRVKEDVIEIGRYLDQAKKHAGHGRWLTWIEVEFGWSDQTARRFIHIYELSRDSKFNNLLNSDLPLSALYQLAAPKTPEAARAEITEHIEAGGEVSVGAVTEIIKKVKGKTKTRKSVETSTGNGEQSIEERKALMAALADAPESSDSAAPTPINVKPRSKKTVTVPEAETLSAHWRRETREARMNFLDDIGAAEILEAVSPEFSKQLQARVDANTNRRKSIELATSAVHGMRGNGFQHEAGGGR